MQESLYAKHNYGKHEVLEELLRLYVQVAEYFARRCSYGNAYAVCKELHELYEKCFPPGSPIISIMEYKLGKLELYYKLRE